MFFLIGSVVLLDHLHVCSKIPRVQHCPTLEMQFLTSNIKTHTSNIVQHWPTGLAIVVQANSWGLACQNIGCGQCQQLKTCQLGNIKQNWRPVKHSYNPGPTSLCFLIAIVSTSRIAQSWRPGTPALVRVGLGEWKPVEGKKTSLSYFLAFY